MQSLAYASTIKSKVISHRRSPASRSKGRIRNRSVRPSWDQKQCNTTGEVVMVLDFANAFYSASKQQMLLPAAAHLPEIAKLAFLVDTW